MEQGVLVPSHTQTHTHTHNLLGVSPCAAHAVPGCRGTTRMCVHASGSSQVEYTVPFLKHLVLIHRSSQAIWQHFVHTEL